MQVIIIKIFNIKHIWIILLLIPLINPAEPTMIKQQNTSSQTTYLAPSTSHNNPTKYKQPQPANTTNILSANAQNNNTTNNINTRKYDRTLIDTTAMLSTNPLYSDNDMIFGRMHIYEEM
eukprot:UN07699